MLQSCCPALSTLSLHLTSSLICTYITCLTLIWIIYLGYPHRCLAASNVFITCSIHLLKCVFNEPRLLIFCIKITVILYLYLCIHWLDLASYISNLSTLHCVLVEPSPDTGSLSPLFVCDQLTLCYLSAFIFLDWAVPPFPAGTRILIKPVTSRNIWSVFRIFNTERKWHELPIWLEQIVIVLFNSTAKSHIVKNERTMCIPDESKLSHLNRIKYFIR